MKNVFEKLVKENKEQIIRYTNELKEAGFTDSDIQDCRDIYNLKYGLMFKESDKGVCEDTEISYGNGYKKGLYNGAKMQLEHVIDSLINNKIKKVITNKHINFHDIYIATRILYDSEAVKYDIILDADEYDENIAVIGEKEFYDYTEEYYIVARKDDDDEEYEYFKIDLDGLQKDYKPTDAELELFE